MIRLLLLFLILCVFYYLQTIPKKESFYPGFRCRCPMCQFYPRSECSTRNMSYDLRGEAYFPLRRNFPFNNSVIGSSNRICYPKRLL